MANRVIKTEELLHYGVKGMKWDESKKKKYSKIQTRTHRFKIGPDGKLIDPPGGPYTDSEPTMPEGLSLEEKQKWLDDRLARREQEFRDQKAEEDREYQREKKARENEENRKQLAELRLKLVNARKKGLSFMVTALVKAIKIKEAAVKRYEETIGQTFSKKNTAKHSAIPEVEEFLAHYNEYHEYPVFPSSDSKIPEADKSKSISEMTTEELRRLMSRLRDEREAEDIIRSLRRSAGLKDSYENPAKIDTKTPVDQLYHWGILGQKWGVRRFQNKDGSRTAAGKRREEEQEKSEDYVKTRESRKKGSAGLSNEELRRINERLRLEADYKNLTTEKMEKAESFVGKALKKAAGEALTDFAKSAMVGAAKLMVKEISPEFADVAFNIKKAAVAAPASKPEAEKKKQQK